MEFDHPVNVDNVSETPNSNLKLGMTTNPVNLRLHFRYGSHQLTFEYRVRDGDDTSANLAGS